MHRVERIRLAIRHGVRVHRSTNSLRTSTTIPFSIHRIRLAAFRVPDHCIAFKWRQRVRLHWMAPSIRQLKMANRVIHTIHRITLIQPTTKRFNWTQGNAAPRGKCRESYSLRVSNYTFLFNFFFGRNCGSYDALTSPQQPTIPSWHGQKSHKCNKQNSQQQLYQCSSECSDHSLKSHSLSQHSHSSQERSKNSSNSSGGGPNCKEGCKRSLTKSHQHNHQKKHSDHDIANGNTQNIYENDDEASERDQMIATNTSVTSYPTASETDRHSDCCSSVGDADGDTCCSCSESSCVYAEAVDPMPVPSTHMAKAIAQNWNGEDKRREAREKKGLQDFHHIGYTLRRVRDATSQNVISILCKWNVYIFWHRNECFLSTRVVFMDSQNMDASAPLKRQTFTSKRKLN